MQWLEICKCMKTFKHWRSSLSLLSRYNSVLLLYLIAWTSTVTWNNRLYTFSRGYLNKFAEQGSSFSYRTMTQDPSSPSKLLIQESRKMVSGFRYYRALESVNVASALSTALTIYPCQIRVHQRWQSKLLFLQLGRRSGGRPQLTVHPMRLPVNTVIHTTLVEASNPQPSEFRSLVDWWSDVLYQYSASTKVFSATDSPNQ